MESFPNGYRGQVFENMHTLDLSHNRIESNIPSAFGNMVQLRQVRPAGAVSISGLATTGLYKVAISA